MCTSGEGNSEEQTLFLKNALRPKSERISITSLLSSDGSRPEARQGNDVSFKKGAQLFLSCLIIFIRGQTFFCNALKDGRRIWRVLTAGRSAEKCTGPLPENLFHRFAGTACCLLPCSPARTPPASSTKTIFPGLGILVVTTGTVSSEVFPISGK